MATFLVALSAAWKDRRGFEGVSLGGLLDPRTLVISVRRLSSLVRSAPGASTIERLDSVASTLRNAMTDGNRRIYRDIGGTAQRYLTYRRSLAASPSPEQVLADFSLPGLARADLARQAYQFAVQHLWDKPQPIDFGSIFPQLGDDSRPLVIAGLALYERAARAQDPAVKNACISFANNFVIYREQRDAVQPAFTPGRTLPGEVDRTRLMELITPGLEVSLRLETWTLWEYAESAPPPRAAGVWTSRVSEYNWAVFDQRWAPVIDTFGPCYRNPAAMWPPPSPDPSAPM
jgi:hypothetical protein